SPCRVATPFSAKRLNAKRLNAKRLNAKRRRVNLHACSRLNDTALYHIVTLTLRAMDAMAVGAGEDGAPSPRTIGILPPFQTQLGPVTFFKVGPVVAPPATRRIVGHRTR